MLRWVSTVFGILHAGGESFAGKTGADPTRHRRS